MYRNKHVNNFPKKANTILLDWCSQDWTDTVCTMGLQGRVNPTVGVDTRQFGEGRWWGSWLLIHSPGWGGEFSLYSLYSFSPSLGPLTEWESQEEKATLPLRSESNWGWGIGLLQLSQPSGLATVGVSDLKSKSQGMPVNPSCGHCVGVREVWCERDLMQVLDVLKFTWAHRTTLGGLASLVGPTKPELHF